MIYKFGRFQPHSARVIYTVWDVGYRCTYSNTQHHLTARAIRRTGRSGVANSQKLLSRLQNGVGICAVLTGDAVAMIDVNKLFRIG